jgi:uncharacterized GH25 family protein
MWTRRALLAGTAALVAPLLAEDVPMTKLQVEVTDEKGRPVNRAAVIVRFIEGRSVKRLGRKKKVQWEMKTDQQGIAYMPALPQGKILVQVIAKNYQTFGEYVEVYEEERTVQVELNPPQPQYSAH